MLTFKYRENCTIKMKNIRLKSFESFKKLLKISFPIDDTCEREIIISSNDVHLLNII